VTGVLDIIAVEPELHDRACTLRHPIQKFYENAYSGILLKNPYDT
jgi:hypothetical protein